MAGLMKKISLYKKSYFPESFVYILNKIRAELILANYAIKFNIRKQMLIHQKISEKADLASLKSDLD